MLTNLANYLNNDFPFHMFFAVQILLAEGLFVVRMKSRLRPRKIVLPVVLCYLVLAWFHPLLGHRFARGSDFCRIAAGAVPDDGHSDDECTLYRHFLLCDSESGVQGRWTGDMLDGQAA